MAEAGSVWVSVVPSLKGFSQKVNAELRGLSVDVGLNVNAKAAQAKIDEATRNRDVTVGVDADTGAATSKLAAFRDIAKSLVGGVHVNVDVDTGGALVKLGALKGVMSTLAMPAGIVAATPFLLNLGSSAVQAAGSLALLPAAGLAGAIAIGGLKVATSGVGAALSTAFDPTKAKQFQAALAGLSPQAKATVLDIQGLGPALNNVKMSAQDALFNGLGPMIRGLADPYLPIASTVFTRIGGSVNYAAQQFGGWLQGAYAIGLVRTIGDGAATTFGNLMRAVAPLGAAFIQIGAIGMPILAQLTSGAAGVAGRFAAWTGSAQGINTIRGWILQSIVVIQQLWQLALNVGSILGSMFAGASANGQSFLSTLVRITGAVAAALNTPAGAAGLAGAMAMIRDVVGMVWDKLVILWPAIQAAGLAFFNLMQAASPITNLFYTLLVPALTAIFQAISFLSPVLGPLIALYGIWTAVQWALNIAMDANPIGLLIGAIIGLVAIIIYAYTNFGWFRTAVDAVGQAFVWLWQSVIVPAWTAIAGAFSWAWTNVLQPIFSFIGTALMYLGIAIGTLLVAPFVIAWNIISGIVSAVWNGVLSPIWYGAIVPALQFLGSVFVWLWQNVVVPVWQGISSAISAAWGFVSGIFSAIWGSVTGFLGPIFTWLLDNIIRPVWSGISAAIQGAWGFIMGIFNVGKAAVTAVGQVFQSVADWIGRAWNTIREATRAPVQFVVDVVYNHGILPVWNGIAGLFGMAQLAPVHLATGGVLSGYAPGVDSVPAMLSRGEGVLVPEAVRGLGPAFVGWANRHFSGGRSSGGRGTPQGGGFSKGGIAHFADGGILGGIGSFLSGSGDFFAKIFTDPVGAVRDLFADVTGSAGQTPGSGSWTDALKNIPAKMIDGVIQKVKDWIASIGSLGGGGGFGVGRWSGVAAAALAMAGAPMSWLPLLMAQMNTESGGNPGAINLYDSNAQKGTPSKGLMQVIDPTFNSYAGMLRGLGVWNPLANIYAAIKYVQGRYGSPFGVWAAGHGYANGGVIPGYGAGDTVPIWTTPGERVLTTQQNTAFESLVGMLATNTGTVSTGYRPGDMGVAGGGNLTGTLYLDSGAFVGQVEMVIDNAHASQADALNSGRRV